MPTSRHGENTEGIPEMTTMFPTPEVTGSHPIAGQPPLTDDDAAVHHDHEPLLPTWFGWGCTAIALSFVWIGGLTGVWALGLIALAIITLPPVVERWFTWSEARIERLSIEAELAELDLA
jgi:hypothetical protein